MKILVTGSTGFIGRQLCDYLSKSHSVIGLDIIHHGHISLDFFHKCDITDYTHFSILVAKHAPDVLIHLASLIDFATIDQDMLYTSNVKMAQNVARVVSEQNIPHVIFSSSNSVFLGQSSHIILQDTPPYPTDLYGLSKLTSELYLTGLAATHIVQIIRFPMILDDTRLGMLSVLFQLIQQNATLWMPDSKPIRHQALSLPDALSLITCLLSHHHSLTLNVSCGYSETFHNIFAQVIDAGSSKSKLRSLPWGIGTYILRLLYKFRVSPIGPYQIRMLTSHYEVDISSLKHLINWEPKDTTSALFRRAYMHYAQFQSTNLSANLSSVNLGILRLLQYIRF